MKTALFIKNIRNYALIAFFIPLIAINACLLLYKFIGDETIKKYPNFDWDEQSQSQFYNVKDFVKTIEDSESYTFTNCPKYKYFRTWTTIEGKIVVNKSTLYEDNLDLTIEEYNKRNKGPNNLIAENKVRSIKTEYINKLNAKCIKNHQVLYLLFTKFNFLEKIFIKTIKENATGFSKIKNPYIYGEVSISRSARYFPATFIFKPLIILASIFLFLFWMNNLNVFNELKNNNILGKFSKKFFYIGVLSSLFLIIHAVLLGLDLDVKWFNKLRRLIITLFIFTEVIAQILLTKKIYENKVELKNYINISVLKIKIIFVILILFLTILSFVYLVFFDPAHNFKNILEWNYFTLLLIYYALSRFVWMKPKN